MYWFHSLVLVVLSCFGGGTVGPILLGRPSAPIANDLSIPMCILLWYMVFYLGLFQVLQWAPLRFVWTALLGLFRTHGAVGAVNLALSVLQPGTT